MCVAVGVAETAFIVLRPLPALTVPGLGRRGRGKVGLLDVGVKKTAQVDQRGEAGLLWLRDEREHIQRRGVDPEVDAEVGNGSKIQQEPLLVFCD